MGRGWIHDRSAAISGKYGCCHPGGFAYRDPDAFLAEATNSRQGLSPMAVCDKYPIVHILVQPEIQFNLADWEIL